jgi:hypothetical protein
VKRVAVVIVEFKNLNLSKQGHMLISEFELTLILKKFAATPWHNNNVTMNSQQITVTRMATMMRERIRDIMVKIL